MKRGNCRDGLAAHAPSYACLAVRRGGDGRDVRPQWPLRAVSTTRCGRDRPVAPAGRETLNSWLFRTVLGCPILSPAFGERVGTTNSSLLTAVLCSFRRSNTYAECAAALRVTSCAAPTASTTSSSFRTYVELHISPVMLSTQ